MAHRHDVYKYGRFIEHEKLMKSVLDTNNI